MKHSLIIIAVFLFAISTPTVAGQLEYDNCILKSLKGAKLDLSTQLIKQACKESHKNPNATSAKKSAYNKCILKHLIGVESFQAVMEIRSSCSSKYK